MCRCARRRSIRGQSVLITRRGRGSLLVEIARQVYAFEPGTLHLPDVNETGLDDLERDLVPQ